MQDYDSVDDYIARQPKEVQASLKQVRAVIRKAAPEAIEGISYCMPAYKLYGKPLVYFAGWKEHYALYPASGTAVAEFKEELANYEVGKGTIRFPIDEKVPAKLIRQIVKFRAKLVEEAVSRAKSKSRTFEREGRR